MDTFVFKPSVRGASVGTRDIPGFLEFVFISMHLKECHTEEKLEISRNVKDTRSKKDNEKMLSSVQFSRSVMSDSVTPWTTACQASLSITSSQSLPKLMSIESVMPSNPPILCHPLLLPPSIFPSFRVFSNESVLHIRWPNYWSFSFSISPSNEYSGLIS